MNYNYPNPYNQQYIQSLQSLQRETEQRLQQAMQNQAMPSQQPTAINQTFQLANTNNTNDFDGKYAKDVEEVKNTFVIKTGLFVNQAMDTLWVKDVAGTIKTFNLTEVIELDEKDKEIIALKQQIEDMKGMMVNAKSDNANVNEPTTSKKPSRVSNAKSNDD